MLMSALNPPRIRPDCRLIWIWGPSGCGKSFAARVTLPERLSLRPVIKSAFDTWWPPQSAASDFVLIEDIDTTFNARIGLSSLKIWGDKYPFEAFFKGGSVEISPALVVITSNYSPEYLFD